jgi:pimeloyl-ACP methyl ester carboxylesterase
LNGAAAPADDYRAATSSWEFDAGAVTLRGRRAEADGPRVHFLSGNGFCGGVYWPFLRRFLDRGLFVHDMEGQGESDAPKQYSGIAATVARVRAAAHAQGVDARPMIGMGHSFGAAVTLRTAAENPGMFRALVLLDPILFPTLEWLSLRALSTFGGHPFARAARRRRTAWPTRKVARDHLRGRGIYQGWTEEALTAFVDHALVERGGHVVLRCPRELEAEIYEHPVYPWRLIRKVDVPILFLRGASSYDFFAKSERTAARANRRIQVQHLPGGHCFMQEDPGAAHAAVAAFLSRHA